MDSVCQHCNYDNPLGANFCMSCGKQLSRPQFDEHTATLDATGPTDVTPASVPDAQADYDRLQAVFVVRVGSKRGSRIALDADRITIGRHPESDIFLDDITVSRRHAEVTRTPAGFEVTDAGSLNGTYINKELIERGMLTDGDELQVGKFKLVFLELGAED